MILLCGIPSEPPLAMVRAELERLGGPVVLFNQRCVADCHLALEVRQGRVGGVFCIEGDEVPLDEVRGVYVRPMDDQHLPEVRGLAAEDPARDHARSVHDLLIRWLDVAAGRIVNRPGPMGSNMSKPYQAQLIRRCGFDVPETLITNEPERVLAFRRRHGRIIFKSISGARSIVRTLEDGDLPRLERIRSCPTQFQAYIDGFNVRVHTVGPHAFATRVESDVTDYRYATRQNGDTTLTAFDLPEPWPRRCVALAGALGLDFAGIDLKLAGDGRVYCFEVNPCPAFSYYEAHTDQPIARTVAEYLMGR